METSASEEEVVGTEWILRSASRALRSPGFPPITFAIPFQSLSLDLPHLPTSKCQNAFGFSLWTSPTFYPCFLP